MFLYNFEREGVEVYNFLKVFVDREKSPVLCLYE
jgi:hypothetical protein